MTYRQRTILILTAVAFVLPAAMLCADDASPSAGLIAVLQSDASTFDRTQACQALAAISADEAVPALAALLADEQLSAYARSALEAVAAPSAGEALLAALDGLGGNLLVGVINSLGVRREAIAVDALSALVRDDDQDVAAAALAALGKIATPDAAKALLKALARGRKALRIAAADACLDCADQYLSAGRPHDAVAVYRCVAQARVPEHVRLAATFRTMVAQGEDGVPDVMASLRSDDDAVVAMALRAMRDIPGHDMTRAMIDELERATPELQVMLIAALAERGGKKTWAAINEMASSDVLEVRLAAMKALGPTAIDVERLVFVPLFDGATFDGWEGDTGESFRIEDGAIVGGSLQNPVPRNEFLCTTRSYANFILRLECRVVNANGGIQFRSQRVPDSAEVSGYQADMDSGGSYWGCLYDESRRGMLVEADREETQRIVKKDDWNEYEIRCEGQRIRLLVNGVQTIEYTETDASIPLSGIIAVQVHAGDPSETWYRNISIAELP